MISKERKIQWNCLLSYPKKNWLIERFGLLNRIMKNTLIGHKFGSLNRKCWLVAYLERSIHYSGETDKACKIPTYLLKIAMSASKQLDNSKLGSTQQSKWHWHVAMIICSQKIYGLYGIKHHIVEIRGDVTMRDGRTNERTNEQTTEDRATQPMEAGGWVSQFRVAFNKMIRQ